MRYNSAHTERAYTRWIERFKTETGGELPDPWAVQGWLEGLAEGGYSQASIAQARAAVTKWGKRLRLQGELERGEYLALTLEVETPKGAQTVRERRWLTVGELQGWMAEMASGGTENARLRNCVAGLLLGTLGLREAEAAQAEWQHLLQTGNGLKLLVEGKGGSRALVDVPHILAEALMEWRGAIQREVGAAPEDSKILRRVWKSGAIDGRGVGTSSLYRMVRAAGERAGLGTVSPHDIRATVAGLLHDAGVQMEDISRLLRHKNQEVTRRYIGRRGAGASHVMGMLVADGTGHALSLHGPMQMRLL